MVAIFHRSVAVLLLLLMPLAKSLSLVPGSVASGRRNAVQRSWSTLRGGEQVQSEDVEAADDTPTNPVIPKKLQAVVLPITTALASAGRFYYKQLGERPVLTKSATAGVIFALSDYLAQKIEQSKADNAEIDSTRVLASTLIGFCYFGPAAHYWYEMIFKLLPGTGLLSTMYKAFWGQAIFGPSFTCIFFAASLIQSGDFTLGKWVAKIKSDLPGAWLAGAGYWPLVDFISYSVVPIIWIPLFVNVCSLIWTIYLSIVANRS